MDERLYRLFKEGEQIFVNNTVFDSKGAGYWKAKGWKVDSKPYKYEKTKTGLKPVLDQEAYSKEVEIMERADKEGGTVEKKEPVKRSRKKKEA